MDDDDDDDYINKIKNNRKPDFFLILNKFSP